MAKTEIFDYEKLAHCIVEAFIHAMDERELRKNRSALSHRCQSRHKSDFETLDKTPLAVPMDCKVPESLDSILQRHIATYMAKMSNQEGYAFDEDLSELDDYEADDFVSKHEFPDVESRRVVTFGNEAQVSAETEAVSQAETPVADTKNEAEKE